VTLLLGKASNLILVCEDVLATTNATGILATILLSLPTFLREEIIMRQFASKQVVLFLSTKFL
jgi:hypothetical protein